MCIDVLQIVRRRTLVGGMTRMLLVHVRTFWVRWGAQGSLLVLRARRGKREPGLNPQASCAGVGYWRGRWLRRFLKGGWGRGGVSGDQTCKEGKEESAMGGEFGESMEKSRGGGFSWGFHGGEEGDVTSSDFSNSSIRANILS